MNNRIRDEIKDGRLVSREAVTGKKEKKNQLTVSFISRGQNLFIFQIKIVTSYKFLEGTLNFMN